MPNSSVTGAGAGSAHGHANAATHNAHGQQPESAYMDPEGWDAPKRGGNHSPAADEAVATSNQLESAGDSGASKHIYKHPQPVLITVVLDRTGGRKLGVRLGNAEGAGRQVQ